MAEAIDNTLRKSRRSKAPGAFRTISEVADDLEVPQHVLRFWESKFVQVKPLKRGGGRRYYRPADVDLLRGIRHLLYSDGYTIKGVQKLLREIGSKSIIDFVRNTSHGNTFETAAGQIRRKGSALFRDNSGVSPGKARATTTETYEGRSVNQAQSMSLTSLQRNKLEQLEVELIALRNILREARKN